MSPLVRTVICMLAAASLATSTGVLACGEGMVNAGKGLPFQSYLAPHQADILILADGPRADNETFYRGLEQAGHNLTVVENSEAMKKALAERRFDIVIGPLEAAEELASNPVEATRDDALPAVLPVVARSERNQPRVRDRFALFVLDGASLGQFLDAINRALAGSS